MNMEKKRDVQRPRLEKKPQGMYKYKRSGREPESGRSSNS